MEKKIHPETEIKHSYERILNMEFSWVSNLYLITIGITVFKLSQSIILSVCFYMKNEDDTTLLYYFEK